MGSLRQFLTNLHAWWDNGMFWHEVDCYFKTDKRNIVAYCTRADGSKYYLLSGGQKIDVLDELEGLDVE